jgi:TPR repeat protein
MRLHHDKMRSLLPPLLALCCVLAAAVPLASPAAEEPDQATALYDQGEFKKAYKKYLKSARRGDPLARYRVSYMSVMGLGTKRDPVDSMIWAVLAEEVGPPSLSKYRQEISKLVPVEDRKKAQRQADRLRRRFSEQASAGGDCTGSRLATACGGSQSFRGRPIAWPDDMSDDPEQLRRIEEMNEVILQKTFGMAPAMPAN